MTVATLAEKVSWLAVVAFLIWALLQIVGSEPANSCSYSEMKSAAQKYLPRTGCRKIWRWEVCRL